MKIKREWAMPNSKTFKIKPIKELIKKYGFEIIEILDVAHGSMHNDTLVTVELKEK